VRRAAPDAKVWVADSAHLKKVRTFGVNRLLPAAFTTVPGVSV